MKKFLFSIAMLILLAILAGGCAQKPSADGKILASVGNKFITLEGLKSRIAKLPAYYQSLIRKNTKRYLDETIVEMLFYEEAMRKNLDRDPEVKEVVREAKKKILIAKLMKTDIEDKITVSDEEIRRFYEAHKEEFKSPELWRASHILVSTQKEAEDIQAELAKGASFEELAKVQSIDATASRGGDIGYFRLGQLVPEFENACTVLSVGQVSPIIHTQFGYHIIKLTDKKEPAIEPLENVRQNIITELKKKKRSELFDKLVLNLKTKYRVRVEDDVFTSLEKLQEEPKTAGKSEKKNSDNR